MKKFKVLFTSPHFKNPEVFLSTIIKMTPGKKGIWKEMEATTDLKQADFVVCVDGYPTHKYPIERTLFFAQHPQGIPAFKTMDDVKDKALAVFPADTSLCIGEWWIEEDYDTLMAMEPPKKEKNLLSITTYRDKYSTYIHRIKFLESYTKVSKDIDVYGRQERLFEANPILNKVYKGILGNKTFDGRNNEHTVGKGVLKNYRYSLDFDHGVFPDGDWIKNYFSERFFDSMLLWAMPIYFGSDNIQNWLPENSFRYVDIRKWDNINEINKIHELVKSNFREEHLEDMRQARQLLMNKYSTFAMAYDKIKELI